MSRQTFGGMLAAIYASAGLLLLTDHVMSPAGAVPPHVLGLHVWPLSLVGWLVGVPFPFVSDAAASMGVSAKAATTVVFLASLAFCAEGLRRVVSGRPAGEQSRDAED
ncbi:MAG: hypothetical protein ACT4N2_16155 [Hyphomicrobium sp.]